jgi:hypothetical protein
MVVGEQHEGLPERHPAGVVDLVRHPQGACGRGHLPVADSFGSSLRITVGAGPDLAAQPAAQPRLLLDLAQRRLGLGLARVELALGERPVVIARPVDQDDLDPAALPRRQTIPPPARTTDSVTTRRLAGSSAPARPWATAPCAVAAVAPAQAFAVKAAGASQGPCVALVPGSPVAAPASAPPSRSFPSPWLAVLGLPPATRCWWPGRGLTFAATSASVRSRTSPLLPMVTTSFHAGEQSVTTRSG